MVGRDNSKKFWRVLKIDRSAPSDLVVFEDPTVYTYHECSALLRRINEGNMHAGGLKFVTICYGIVGEYLSTMSLRILFYYDRLIKWCCGTYVFRFH